MMGCGGLRCSESGGEASVLREEGKERKSNESKIQGEEGRGLRGGSREEGGILRPCGWILVHFTITERGL